MEDLPEDLRRLKNHLERLDSFDRELELKIILKNTPIDTLKRMKPILKPYKDDIDMIRLGNVGVLLRERLDNMNIKDRKIELSRILSGLDLNDEEDSLNLRAIFYPYRKEVKEIVKTLI
jgi:hypothetical protein